VLKNIVKLFATSAVLYYIYPMTVTQTVDIPADHRLIIDVPREVPAGRAVLSFTPAVPARAVAGQSKSDIVESLFGIIPDGGASLTELREERLSR
jgi:hypothetical protein